MLTVAALVVLSGLKVFCVEPPPPLPNIDKIGRGYDVMFGNPISYGQDIKDSGYRHPIYNSSGATHQSSDHRYSLPDGIDASIDIQCSLSSASREIYGQTSYWHSVKDSVEASAGDSLKVFSFTASGDFTRISNITTTYHEVIIETKARCTVYDASIETFKPPPFTENFIKGVMELASYTSFISAVIPDSAILKFIDQFGTHISVKAKMGASFMVHSVFREDTYLELVNEKFDVQAGAKASFNLFTGSIDASHEEERKQATYFDTKRTDSLVSYTGSLPPHDGKWETWAQHVGENPNAHSYQLESLPTLIASANIPSVTTDELASVADQLKGYITNVYCKRGINGCDGPHPDPQLVSFNSVVNSGVKDVINNCPQGFTAISTGFERDTSNPYVAFPAFRSRSPYSGECWDDVGTMKCHTVCSNIGTTSYIETALTEGVVTVSCPRGYVVSSCGYTAKGDKEESRPYSYPNSKSSCEAYNYHGLYADITCVEESLVSNHQVVVVQGSGIVASVCPSDTQLLGCGFRALRHETYWWVRPDLTNNRCIGYNYFSVQIHAICASVYPALVRQAASTPIFPYSLPASSSVMHYANASHSVQYQQAGPNTYTEVLKF